MKRKEREEEEEEQQQQEWILSLQLRNEKYSTICFEVFPGKLWSIYIEELWFRFLFIATTGWCNTSIG